MELNVSQLMMESSGSTREYILDETEHAVAMFAGAGIRGRVNLMRTSKSIWVSASLHSTLDSECGRCLLPYLHPIRVHIEEEYIPTLDPLTGRRLQPSADDGDCFTIDESHILDLTEVVNEYAIMAIPMKPLCREDCAGLCPSCGADLNHIACRCAPATDPRWGALLELMQETR